MARGNTLRLWIREKATDSAGSRSGRRVELPEPVWTVPRIVIPLLFSTLSFHQGISTVVPYGASAQPRFQDKGGPTVTFKGGVEAVTVSVAVRDSHGRVVRNLKETDFQVLDSGMPREIHDFYTGDSETSLALLLDISGSMAVGGNMERAREAVHIALS